MIFFFETSNVTTDMKNLTLSVIALSALLLSSCSGDPSGDSAEGSGSAPDSKITPVFVASAPADPIPVIKAREKATPGSEVTVTGKIAGVANPFTEGFASLVLADESLQTCDLIPGDQCETPWDACCVAPEDIKAQRMTIQIPDGSGMPVAESLKGVNGLKEMDVLVVKGTVDGSSTPENLILNAAAIFKK